MLKPQYFFIILIFMALGCKSSQQSKSEMYPIITMEKTTCMGTCPAYIFKVYPNGNVSYSGTKYVDLMGEYNARISKEKLANLKSLFDKVDYFKFANVYAASIKDLPTTFLYYDNGSQNAKITDYYGAPESLKKLEKDIEEFINSVKWQKN